MAVFKMTSQRSLTLRSQFEFSFLNAQVEWRLANPIQIVVFVVTQRIT